MTKQGKVTLYNCGGGGINIGSYFANSEKGVHGSADLNTVFFDTSRSNMRNNIPEDQCYFLKDSDGSGKFRASNYQAILDVMPEFLTKHKPGDVNIVTFTASGGTGSVAGPILIDNLLQRGELVIAIVIGSVESSAAITNTFNTLTGLELNAAERGVNLPIAYIHHDSTRTRSDVDAEARGFIAALGVVASRQNAELDTKDLEMWINHTQFSKVAPGLNRLHMYSNPAEIDSTEDGILSLVGVLKTPDRPVPTRFIPAAWYGYNDLTAISDDVKDIFMVLTKRGLPELVKTFRTLNDEIKELHSVLEKKSDSFGDANEGTAVKGGLIL